MCFAHLTSSSAILNFSCSARRARRDRSYGLLSIFQACRPTIPASNSRHGSGAFQSPALIISADNPAGLTRQAAFIECIRITRFALHSLMTSVSAIQTTPSLRIHYALRARRKLAPSLHGSGSNSGRPIRTKTRLLSFAFQWFQKHFRSSYEMHLNGLKK